MPARPYTHGTVRNQWYAVLESREVGTKPVSVLRMRERLVFFRDASGNLECLVDRCCHRGVALSAGEIRRHHIMCPFHGLEYDRRGRWTSSDLSCTCASTRGSCAYRS